MVIGNYIELIHIFFIDEFVNHMKGFIWVDIPVGRHDAIFIRNKAG